MRSAFIIVGSELGFWEQACALETYLRANAGIRYVKICEAWNRKPFDLKYAFDNHAIRAGRQPFLLAYIGHGYKDKKTGETGWSYGKENAHRELRLPYETLLTWLIESRDGPTLFLNDCCYAASFLTPAVRENPRLKISMIAASHAQGFCYGYLMNSVMNAWMGREVYVPKIHLRDPTIKRHHRVLEERFGPALDHHFFPKPPAANQAA